MSAQEPKEIDWQDALRKMLQPYEPATANDADTYFSSAEIVTALEQHFLVPQDAEAPSPIDGTDLVDYLHELGFTASNAGGMNLHWHMKKKA